MLLVKQGHASTLEIPEELKGVSSPYRLHAVWRSGNFLHVVRRCVNYALPEDNGYIAIIVPVEGNSTEDLNTIVNTFMSTGQSGPSLMAKYVEMEEGVN